MYFYAWITLTLVIFTRMSREEPGSALFDKNQTKPLLRLGNKKSNRSMVDERLFEGLQSEMDVQSAATNNGLNYSTVNFPENEPVSLKDTIPYYLPCFSWIPSYTVKKCMGDLVAGISLASFQIPLAMSYATSVAHVPPLCGLYSLVFSPMVYTLLGSVPQMIVGPESAISLIIGQAIEARVSEDSHLKPINLCLMITFIAGLVLLIGGLLRFGFLENVLSRALLRGFISAVGIIMVITSLVVELQLNHVTPNKEEHYHSPFEKLAYLHN